MSAIECECQLQQGQPPPVACCGDFVCLTPAGATTGGVKSRVNAIRQLFEDKIHVTENLQTSRGNNSRGKSVPAFGGSHRQRDPIEGEIPQSMQAVMASDQDCARFYRSHTKIVSIPNGVKIITTILADDNLMAGDEPYPAYETLICPESKIIKRFERDMDQAVRGELESRFC